MLPFTLSEAAAMMRGRLDGADASAVVTCVCTDSREAGAGSLFFALKGEKADGHEYAGRARSGGASAAVRSERGMLGGRHCGGARPVVDDPLAALGRMAEAHRSRFRIPVVAITGSMGKTTTREMLAALLRSQMKPLVSPANFNTEIGVPQTLLELTPEHDCAVIEMAMRGPGQIHELCRMVHPGAGVITNVGVTHLELLGTRANIAAAKAELLAELPPDGWAALNVDDDFFAFFRQRTRVPVVTFGLSADADVRAEDVQMGPDGCASFRLVAGRRSAPASLKVPGEFHVMNALAATAAAGRFGIGPDAAARVLSAYEGFEKRSLVRQAPGGWTVFDDTYNASPAATVGALRSLAVMQAAGRRIAALGDMRELGAFSGEGHRLVGEAVAQTNPFMLVTVGAESCAIQESARTEGYAGACRHFDASPDAAEFLRAQVQPGDIILVKGSRALEMENIVERLSE